MSSIDLPFSSSFPPIDKDQWINQIITDLKGQPYKSLQWSTPEGFTTEPVYTSEDLEGLCLTELQSPHTSISPGWLTIPAIQLPVTTDPVVTARSTLQESLHAGADGLLLDTTKAGSVNWARTLRGLKLSDTPVWFRIAGNPTELVNTLNQLMPYQLKGGLFDEPISRLLQSGILTNEAVRQLGEATRLTTNSPQFRTITVSSHVFHNAGANAVQELAFLLASLVELYDVLTDDGFTIKQLIDKTTLSVSVGTSFFTEIAKLRALRTLWHRFISAYSSPALPCYLHAQRSTFYDAAATPYTNLLRATTEAMAAVIGGCNALTVQPYDIAFRHPDEFSERIARNLSLLLKEETHLDKIRDPSAGSYYLENLTHQLVERAWHLFLKVEELGGLFQAFERGFIRAEIDKAYETKITKVQNGQILVGVTQYRFDEESIKNLPRPPSTMVESPLLPNRRLAEKFE